VNKIEKICQEIQFWFTMLMVLLAIGCFGGLIYYTIWDYFHTSEFEYHIKLYETADKYADFILNK